MNDLVSLPHDTTVEAAAQAVRDYGYVIVRDVLSGERLERLRAELEPHLDAMETGTEEFGGMKTKRFGALLRRVPMSREMVLDPIVDGTARAVLGPYSARIQLNYTGVMHLLPGEKAQTLHRDTGFYPFQNPAPPLSLATMWAISDFTAENGATCFIPGSHLWDDSRQPLPEEIRAAEMPAGSVLMYLGATVHGGGANRSNAARCGVALHYTHAWLRQEENQYLAVPLDLARTFPEDLQALMGYELGTVNLGFVDHLHPKDFIDDAAEPGQGRGLGPPDLMDLDNSIERLHIDGTAATGRARYEVEATFNRD